MNCQRLLEKLHLRRPKTSSSSSSHDFKDMECLMNAAALSLFEQHGEELISNTPLYLVPVVWGERTKSFNKLDPSQKEMIRVLTPVLKELKERFSNPESDSNGITGMEYLVKGLMLYKIAYMTQYYINCKLQGDVMPRQNASPLENMEPMGEA